MKKLFILIANAVITLIVINFLATAVASLLAPTTEKVYTWGDNIVNPVNPELVSIHFAPDNKQIKLTFNK